MSMTSEQVLRARWSILRIIGRVAMRQQVEALSWICYNNKEVYDKYEGHWATLIRDMGLEDAAVDAQRPANHSNLKFEAAIKSLV